MVIGDTDVKWWMVSPNFGHFFKPNYRNIRLFFKFFDNQSKKNKFKTGEVSKNFLL